MDHRHQISYKKLSVEKKEIRLLVLTRGSFSWPPLQCVLQTVSLNDCDNYVALSYAWGYPNDTVPVRVNDELCQITSNLDSALRHLLRMTERLVIWVDSICINQSDPFEHADQVKMMGEIYQDAEHVLVWLGEEEDDSDLALEMIRTWGNTFYDHRSTTSTVDSIRDPFEPRAWAGICCLLKRPWWNRLWTLQEAMLGEEVSIICDTKSISWNSLYHATGAWSNRDANFFGGKYPGAILTIVETGIDSGRVSVRLIFWAKKMQNKISNDILEVVSDCRVFDATDPREKIYALTSLTELLHACGASLYFLCKCAYETHQKS